MIYWFLNIVLISLFGFYCFRALRADLPSWMYVGGLVAKLAAGLVLGIIFFYQYESGDTIAFFEAAKDLINKKDASLSSILFDDAAISGFQDQPRVRFFVRILAVSLLVSGGSYWLSALHFSLLSFLAYWYFVVLFASIYPKHKVVTAVCFLFIPTIVFWSSGVIKDTIASAALVFLVAIVFKIYHERRIRFLEVLIGLLGLFILLKIKHYLLIIFLIFTGILLCVRLFQKLKSYQKWTISSLILIASLGLTQFVHPYLKISRIPTTILENNQAIIANTHPEKQLGIVLSDATWGSVLRETPLAFYTGLFKPLIFDKTPLWGLIHKIENLVLLTLIILSGLIFLKSKPRINWQIVLPAAFSITLLVTMLALSTPNLGTLVRYKNACMPFLFLMVSILPYQYLTSKRSE